ncbi:bifunctional folylpolyglutamate synthase/dihydrofolate synthase [Anaerococcus degeneri]|uniref:tetrahydrofolate synthase n=1 Tax=Anaerococcus degeneri TaxID=361500 RepID=A0ABS7YUI7_9FIRM|nr:folylpolyglutamate synthase/dihydrofolate synthase family protein [Anaerococcus degeneri]MBP2015140.1 dihydrofolate synthase/folylpolyglutamate synthase [Anaerococcus degeneri]MCA2095400.1 bifunctional folylpolyglutamate synthase/dihydrofolate synthase [Anaerococcus degeneri]
MKNFDDYLDYLYGRGSSGEDHTLRNIRKVMEAFDNPQDKIKVIHVAGTNGKGSTAKMLANVLSKKIKCGIFTSPYMVRINEEISINGVDISDEDFCDLMDRIRPVAEKCDEEGYHITYFEFLTAMVYIYFYEQKVDVAVIEVGLGGSLDSTNIIKSPLASVICSISMDHMNVLGSTIEEIASNKAGIIKKNRPVFVYPQTSDKAFDIIKEKAREEDSELFTFEKDEIKIKEVSNEGNIFDFQTYKDIHTSLRGKHQIYNASLVLMVLDYFKDDFNLSEEDIKDGIKETYNPGRLDLVRTNPRVLLDGSHNKESIDALLESLKNFEYEKLIVGFSILKDKDHKDIIRDIAGLSDKLIITYIDENPRALDTKEIENEASDFASDIVIIEDNKEAYEYSLKQAGEKDLILWCGSLYLVGKILSFIGK